MPQAQQGSLCGGWDGKGRGRGLEPGSTSVATLFGTRSYPKTWPLRSRAFDLSGFPVASFPFSFLEGGKKGWFCLEKWNSTPGCVYGRAGTGKAGGMRSWKPSILQLFPFWPDSEPIPLHPHHPHLSNTSRIPGAPNPAPLPELPAALLAHKAGPLFCYYMP